MSEESRRIDELESRINDHEQHITKLLDIISAQHGADLMGLAMAASAIEALCLLARKTGTDPIRVLEYVKARESGLYQKLLGDTERSNPQLAAFADLRGLFDALADESAPPPF